MTEIKLVPLAPDDREQFITDNQEPYMEHDPDEQFPDGMFRFEKVIK